jgi:hypothetical protein
MVIVSSILKWTDGNFFLNSFNTKKHGTDLLLHIEAKGLSRALVNIPNQNHIYQFLSVPLDYPSFCITHKMVIDFMRIKV